MTKPRVFISSSNRDARLAARVESALKQAGLEAFNARKLRSDDDWRKEVQSAIKRCDAVVVLVSEPQHLSSSWMSYEVGIGEALGKRVMLLLPDKYPVAELPAEFASTQVVDLDPQALERVAGNIASLLTPEQ